MQNKQTHSNTQRKVNQHSQYYLSHSHKETDIIQPREKILLKSNRKQSSHNSPLTSPILKFQHMQGKEVEQNPNKSSTRKLEKKARSSSSGETPKKPLGKSSLKLQLTSRKEAVPKRVTLHLDVPTTKKPPAKLTLQEMNFDSYYSSHPPLDSKNPLPPHLQLHLPRASSTDLKHLLSRFQTIITDYSCQLQSIRRSNAALEEQNRLLRTGRGVAVGRGGDGRESDIDIM